jgi:M3 family oligoendopeptidase
MKFNEYPYEHIVLEDAQKEIAAIKEQMKAAKTAQEFMDAFKAYDAWERKVHTNETICSIRHTIDTHDEFYTKENDYFNEILPVLMKDTVEVADLVLNSEFRSELEKQIPATWFTSKEMQKKAFSEAIIEDMQQENKLASSYQALVASAQIEFDGETYTLAGLEVKMNDKDRETRKRAHKAYWGWYADHEEEIGSLYDQMVKLRTGMAKKLGFENYIPLGYLNMTRLDYDQNDVENYRKQILEDIVPVANKLYERQRARLGYDKLYAWDEKVEFTSGNPKPKYDKDELVKRAQNMYHELSPETGEYFDFMVEHDLLDLDSKPGKAAGGYCTFIPDQYSPFIFANFNQTSHDAEVLTHEAGHAFQVYSSQNIEPLDCVWPTMESCEIHSMSMEFFTYPWMKDFFEEDTDKYYYNHLGGTIKFLPYGICVDHFQHEVYAHPEMSHAERMATWRRLEKMYLPHKNYDEIDVLERGGWWMRQLHIFMSPFYYVDYTLAQVCALQFWNRLQKNDENAFNDYYKICKVGGTLPFRQIVQTAGLKVPFEDGCLKETAAAVEEWFSKQDDSKY